MAVELSYCVVNTEERELLLRCLDAIAAEQATLDFATEVLVLDNASSDGSASAARRHPRDRRGHRARRSAAARARTTPRCCSAPAGGCACCSTRTPSCCPAPRWRCARRSTPTRAPAPRARACCAPTARQQPSAWRFPTPLTALVGALFLHRRYTVQSRGERTREVDWAQSAALLVRRDAAEQIGWFDPDFFVYSDEVDFCKRLRDAGWRTLYVPGAAAIHHEQLSTGAVPERRIVELSRNRDRYMRKHHTAPAAWAVRLLTAFTYAARAVAALVLPGHDPRRYWRHVTATLRPAQGEGLREAASEHNRGKRL